MLPLFLPWYKRISLVFPPPHMPQGRSLAFVSPKCARMAKPQSLEYNSRGEVLLMARAQRGCKRAQGEAAKRRSDNAVRNGDLKELGWQLLLTTRAGWAAASGSAGASGAWDTSTSLLPETRTA